MFRHRRRLQDDSSSLYLMAPTCILSIRKDCSRYSGQTFQLAQLAAVEPQKRIEFLVRFNSSVRAPVEIVTRDDRLDDTLPHRYLTKISIAKSFWEELDEMRELVEGNKATRLDPRRSRIPESSAIPEKVQVPIKDPWLSTGTQIRFENEGK